jgi:hypothetical protein
VLVSSDTQLVEVDPGATATVVVEVVNTGDIIDGISARIVGLPAQAVNAEPALLPLFPDTSGQVRLTVDVPRTLSAGRHALGIEVVSHGARLPSQYLDLDLDVAPRPALAAGARPRMIRARRSARFVLELRNEGNIALDVSLSAVDADRAVRTRFSPPQVRIDAGAVAPVLLEVRGPRMFTGGEIDRTVTVESTARMFGADADDPTLAEPQLQETTVRLRQRPLISRGMLTALVLAGIIALWAGVFLLGITKVFSGDPMTKQAPASFFTALTAGSGGVGSGSTSGAAAPAGALPKSGQIPAGAGGTITGTVTNANDQQPVGRILIEAWRQTRDGLRLVSSAASQSDGTYSLGGLFPTAYFLKFSAAGFKTVWYPSSPAQSGAQPVAAQAQATTGPLRTVIIGLPASISGAVNPGDTLDPVRTTVTARPLLGPNAGKALATTSTAADGSYQLSGLPAPGTYELTFTTAGYQPSTLVDTVNGGDKRLEPTVTLGATNGQIGGTVTDGAAPLGGVTVSTTVGGKPLTVTTPTTGQVGSFVLGQLPTPGTYVLTFSAPGHGADTKIVELSAGQSRGDVNVVLAAGTGSVTGTVTDTAGNGLGGVNVVVGGTAVTAGAAAPATVTLTSASGLGSFVVNGLAAPGSYTLTFSLAGYQPTTIPVALDANGAPPSVQATLAPLDGSIKGNVISGGSPLAGATVTASDGRRSWQTMSTDSGFVIPGLAPGHYTVTASYPGKGQQTALVQVQAGSASSTTLTLAG